jgi:hypothetical protein
MTDLTTCPQCGKLIDPTKVHRCEKQDAEEIRMFALDGFTMGRVREAARYYERQFVKSAKQSERTSALRKGKREKIAARGLMQFRNAIFYRTLADDYAGLPDDADAYGLEEAELVVVRWNEALVRMHYAARRGATQGDFREAVAVAARPEAVGRA